MLWKDVAIANYKINPNHNTGPLAPSKEEVIKAKKAKKLAEPNRPAKKFDPTKIKTKDLEGYHFLMFLLLKIRKLVNKMLELCYLDNNLMFLFGKEKDKKLIQEKCNQWWLKICKIIWELR